jgi:cation diffusion facilitator CzcD-associated flavoprotein CzcO
MSSQGKNSAETSQVPSSVDVVVVGAGFAGLYMLYRLREMGMRAICFEAADDVGGTWYYNRYPGCRCDVESLQYSYSFSRELQQEWRWTERYAAQPEILRYVQHVADRFDLRRDIRFGTRVTSAVYDERLNCWNIKTDRGDVVGARFCVMASGSLSVPRKPHILGVDSFEGEWYHTGQWPVEGVDVTGKRVGVIGTGSTGLQLVPQLAKQARHLYVFQRTAAFSLPGKNRLIAPEEEAEFKASYQTLRAKMRMSSTGTLHLMTDQSPLSLSSDERERLFEKLWNEGGAGLMYYFNDLVVNSEANALVAEFVRRKIRETVKDPATAEALTPREYPIGTKRICIDIDYFETYNRSNVTLVSLANNPIEEITARSLRTASANYELDCLIFATGYDALTGALLQIDIRGVAGQSLRKKWHAGPRTYLGLASAGFPNLFMITGPGSPSVLSNMLVSIEQHIDWIADCLKTLRASHNNRIEAHQQYEDDWVAHVSELANYTLFVRAASWYMGANIPGKPRVFMPYIGGVGTYRQKCAQVAADGYQGFELSNVDVTSPNA